MAVILRPLRFSCRVVPAAPAWGTLPKVHCVASVGGTGSVERYLRRPDLADTEASRPCAWTARTRTWRAPARPACGWSSCPRCCTKSPPRIQERFGALAPFLYERRRRPTAEGETTAVRWRDHTPSGGLDALPPGRGWPGDLRYHPLSPSASARRARRSRCARGRHRSSAHPGPRRAVPCPPNGTHGGAPWPVAWRPSSWWRRAASPNPLGNPTTWCPRPRMRRPRSPP